MISPEEYAGRLLVYGGIYALTSMWWTGVRGGMLILLMFSLAASSVWVIL